MTAPKNKLAIAFMSLFIVMTPIKLFAYDIQVANEDGTTIYYSWNNDTTELAVSQGEYNSPIANSGRLVIPAKVSYQGKEYPVTSIERLAYCNSNNLKSVVIPNTVTSIGDYAFCGCFELTDVVIPNSVKTIGDCVFYICDNLTDVTIPDSLTSIGGWAFAECPKLTSMTIPKSLTSIGMCAFQNDFGLTSVRIYCKEIGSWFAGLHGIKEVVLGECVETIGKSAFYYLDLEKITIPSSVTSIGKHAFSSCRYLKDVSIPVSVETIESGAFQDCISLMKVTIEGSPVIKDETFDGCNRIDTIILKSPTPPITICNVYEDHRTCRGYFEKKTYNEAKLFIPKGSCDAYSTAETWSKFSNIYTYSDVEYESDFESDSIYYVFLDGGIYVASRWEKNHDYGDGPLTPRDPQSGGQQPRTPSRRESETHKESDSEGDIHYGIDGRIIQPGTPGLHLIKHKDGTVTKSLVR